MIEQTANAITFYFTFVESKLGKTGLTTAVYIYRKSDLSVIVNGLAGSELGRGVYYYTLASGSTGTPSDYIGIAETATTSVDCRAAFALWVVGPDWVENLDAPISETAVPGDAMTLTQSALALAQSLTGSTISIYRGDTLTINFTGLGNLASRTALYFTVKDDRNKADSAALIQIKESDGLTVIQGAPAGTASNGSLTVTNAGTGAITIVLKAAETALLAATGTLYYDVQMVTASGVNTLTTGQASVTADVTRALS